MKLNKLLCGALAALTAFSFAACGTGTEPPINGGNEGNGGNNQTEKPIVYTDYDLVSNKTSDYKIVLDSEALYNERLAKDEIIEFFYQATGITLTSVTDDKAVYSKDSKLIILGDTAFTSYSGVDISKIPEQGYTVKTVDSNVFILGENYGVLYGAYEFLTQAFDFEIYAQDAIKLKTGVTSMKLPEVNVSDSPDILWREPNYGTLYDLNTANRFRVHNNIWMTERGNFVHNTFDEYFPKGNYEKEHPEYYSETKQQLCYTAHGDADALEAMQNVVFERIKELVNKFYNQGDFRGSISFSQEDNNSWCQCSACAKSKEAYGTDAAVVIKFLNPVAKKVQEWLEEEWPGHTLNIAFFAYYKTENAPVQLINGEYTPVRKLLSGESAEGETTYSIAGSTYVKDESVVLEDNIALFYAPINGQYMWDFNHQKNAQYMDTLKKWRNISNNFYLWFYSTNYRDYLVWYDSFNSMQSMYRLSKEYNANYLFDQGRYNAYALTAFDSLKVFLNCKLAWNVEADVTSLTAEFFENYFGLAAPAITKYYNSYRSWSQYVKDNLGISGQCLTGISDKKYWPQRILESWNDLINEAYEAIAPLKASNPTEYDKIYDRILCESIAIRYHLYDLYGDKFDSTTLKTLRTQFKTDANRLGFTNISESGSLADNVYAKWGV